MAIAAPSALRARVLARWSAREGDSPECLARRAEALDRCLDALDGPAPVAPAPCGDVSATQEVADAADTLVHLSATLRDLTRTDGSVAPGDLAALADVVDASIEAHVATLGVTAERALAAPELHVPEEQGAADEVDYVWDAATDGLAWEDRRVFRTVPVAEDLGTTRAELLARVHPADRDRVARTLRDAIEGGDELFWSEYRLRRADGTWADVMDRAVLVRSEGRVVRAIGHLRERTMVRRLLRELEESEERLAAATTAAEIGTFRIDVERRMSIRDATFNHILGLPAETTTQAFGEAMAWVHEGDRDAVGADLERAMKEGAPIRVECRVVRGDGAVRRVRGRARALRGEDGRVRWVTGALIDVTAEHDAMVERMRLLEEARRSRAEAEAAGRAKEEFLALVSHELRSPLHAMLGWLALLREGKLDEARRARAFDTVERNARAQVRLVEDLLDMSRILAGKLRLEVEIVDVGALAVDVAHAWEPAALAKSIAVSVTPGPDGERVLGDPQRLQQVLSNLLGNAIKFTPAGGRVEIRVDRADGMVRAVVRDSGPGIAADARARIFDRFQQARGEGARRESGLGLGLAIVKQIVEHHGGTVRAEAPEGWGTAIVVELPRRESL